MPPECRVESCTYEAVDRVFCSEHLPAHPPIDAQFERQLAFCFGIEDRDSVLDAFIAALEQFNNGDVEAAEAALTTAYQVIRGNGWPDIDAEAAAERELILIFALQHNASEHDVLVENMMKLYGALYDRNVEDFRAAAELRTFIYRYKHLRGQQLTAEDKQLLIAQARRSEEMLLALVEK